MKFIGSISNHRGARSEDGSGVVEFALVGMILVLLVSGVWDFGRLFNAWLVTTNAAREGARYAAVFGADRNMTESDVVNQVKQKTLEYLDAGLAARGDVQPYAASDVIVQFPAGRSIGERVKVTVSLRVAVWPLARDLFFGGSDSAAIQGAASMRI
ncbi:MAG: pilus assembly protein [Chloroflexi bacterium]|nr:pilus assembly protein [Chloroflexota bacterium]